MNYLTLLQNKISFLQEFDEFGIVDKVDKIITEYQKEGIISHFPSVKSLLSLKLDLSYLFTRYKHWFQSSFFSDFVTDFLQREYLISRQVSESCFKLINEQITEFIPELKAKAELAHIDRDFIFELICLCIATDDYEQLAEKIGFGMTILSVINNAIEMGDRNGQSYYVFDSSVDQKIQEAVKELNSIQTTTKWFNCLCKLRANTSQKGLNQRAPLTIDELKQLFSYLAQIQPNGIDISLISSLNEMSKSDKSKTNELSKKQAIKLLEFYKLIYKEKQSNKKEYLFLTHQGLEITLDKHVSDAMQSLKENSELICSLPELIQAAVLKSYPSSDEKLYSLLEAHGKALSPRGIGIAIKRLKGGVYSESVIRLADKIIWNIENLWTRAAICRALTEYCDLPLTSQVLGPIAQNDPSPKVRRIARDFLVAR